MNIGIQIKDRVYGVQEEVAMYIADLRQQIVMLDKALVIAQKDEKAMVTENEKLKALLSQAEEALKAKQAKR